MASKKVISSGIILWKLEDNQVKFFLCTPGGPLWSHKDPCWNFPKGQVEPEESAFEAAIREFTEETGVRPASLVDIDYVYHGLIKQREGKSVHVFSKQWGGEQLDHCQSNLFTWEKDGKMYPEIGDYRWMTYDEVHGHGVKAYYPIFKAIETAVLRNANIAPNIKTN